MFSSEERVAPEEAAVVVAPCRQCKRVEGPSGFAGAQALGSASSSEFATAEWRASVYLSAFHAAIHSYA